MLNSDEYEELEEQLYSLAEYYSEATGRNVELGISEDHDIWLDTMRTNGKEYYESVDDAESRIKELYSEVFMDDNLDFLEGI